MCRWLFSWNSARAALLTVLKYLLWYRCNMTCISFKIFISVLASKTPVCLWIRRHEHKHISVGFKHVLTGLKVKPTPFPAATTETCCSCFEFYIHFSAIISIKTSKLTDVFPQWKANFKLHRCDQICTTERFFCCCFTKFYMFNHLSFIGVTIFFSVQVWPIQLWCNVKQFNVVYNWLFLSFKC